MVALSMGWMLRKMSELIVDEFSSPFCGWLGNVTCGLPPHASNEAAVLAKPLIQRPECSAQATVPRWHRTGPDQHVEAMPKPNEKFPFCLQNRACSGGKAVSVSG